MVEHFLSICEAPGPISSTTKDKVTAISWPCLRLPICGPKKKVNDHQRLLPLLSMRESLVSGTRRIMSGIHRPDLGERGALGVSSLVTGSRKLKQTGLIQAA